jgi:hypothetical protein
MVWVCMAIIRLALRLGQREWATRKAGELAAIGASLALEPRQTRIIRATADIYKPGHVLTIDRKKFYVTRLLSASPKEVLYEAETR